MEYKIGDVVIGRVIALKPYGAFITLANNTTGLLHISEISHGYVKDVNSALKLNEEVKVKIMDIDKKNKQIIFSIRALTKPKRLTKANSRFKKKETIMETKTGFTNLKTMLPVWVADYFGGNHD